MKKALLLFGIAAGLSVQTNAQLAVNDIAPDFTLTDINGVQHNLYTYLDQGYSVLIDVSAAWCGPCWAGHQSDFMNNLEAEYGASGTIDPGKIKVIFIEGEATNTTDQLHGIGTTPPDNYADGTMGDWVSGQNYIFIDDASVNQYYLDGGFPTYTVIAPNRQVMLQTAGFGSSMGQTSFWTPYFLDAPIAVTGDNAGVINSNTLMESCAGEPISLNAVIQNMGTGSLTSATIEAKINGTVVASTNWTGSLNSTYDYEEVTIGDITPESGLSNIEYVITSSNDQNSNDDMYEKELSAPQSEYKTWVLKIKTDYYPGETSWKVMDEETGQAVHQGTFQAGTDDEFGGGGADALKEFSYPLPLEADHCYKVVIEDSYGDGMTQVPDTVSVLPYVKVYDGDDATLVKEIDVAWGFSSTENLITTGDVVEINEIENLNTIQIYPNPTVDQLTASFNAGTATTMDFFIYDITGKQVQAVMSKEVQMGYNKVTFNTSGLHSGIYLLKLQSQEGSTQFKFTKK